MAIFTLKQKIFIVKRYYQCGNSTEKVQNEYPREFDDDGDKPTDDNIIELINLFEEFGSVLKYRKKSIDSDLGNAEEPIYNNFEIKQEIDPLSNDGTASNLETKNHTDLDEKLDIGVASDTADSFEETILNHIPCGLETNPLSNEDTDSETKNKADFDDKLCIDVITDLVDSVEEQINNDFPCDQCERIFKSKGAYANHLKIHEKKCKICKTKCSMMIKERTMHTEDPSSDVDRQIQEDGHLKNDSVVHSVDKVHWCCLCQKSFKTRIRLKAHERTHLTDQERPQKCEVCGKGFLKKYALQLHVKTHSGDKQRRHKGESQSICNIICDICGQALSSKLTLKFHMRRHTGEKPHQCPFCDKKYSQINSLVNHKRSHTGAKPFTCNICGKSVTTKNSLKNHKDTIHGGAKPYECTFCSNKYTSWTALKIHKRIHTGERPFCCQYCSKEFYDPATCRRHERTHTGEKPYKCTICGKLQNQLSHLKTHMKNVHKQEHSPNK